MKDLSKEERLEQEILEMAEKCGDKKWLRIKRTFFILCGVIYFLLLVLVLEGDINISNANTTGNMNTMEIIETIFYAIVALTVGVGFLAGCIMFISYGILFYIIDGSMKDEKAIAKKIGELNGIKYGKH